MASAVQGNFAEEISLSSRNQNLVIVVPRSSVAHALRVAAEYGVTIGIAALLSYLILGGHW